METATLRIKFQPLLQEVDRGESNCYLEIIPQVTAANDIEKIKWALDDDLVEYTVPMTYRIIIRKEKKRRLDTNSNSSIKVYHSCVDLLHSYSIMNVDANCGDVTRIISDNFFLTRLASSVDFFRSCKNHKENKEIESVPKSSSVHNIAHDASVLCHLPIPIPFDSKKEAVNIELPRKVCVSKATSYDLVCNIECDIAVVDYNKEKDAEANNIQTPIIYTPSPDLNVHDTEPPAENGTLSESNRKLTISAVYSFDTSNVIDLRESVESYVEEFSNDNVTLTKHVGTLHMTDDSTESRKVDAVKKADHNVTRALLSVFDSSTSPMTTWNRKIKISRSLNTENIDNDDKDRTFKVETDLSKDKSKTSSIFRVCNSSYIENTYKKSDSSCVSNGFDIFEQFKPKNMKIKEDNMETNIVTKRSSLIYRPTVESRVAKYKTLMEKEILPLKLKLNDIRNKAMDHKYRSTAVENLVESLSFEVEAVPQDHLSQHKSTSHLSPVNVKVRVRKKDKCSMQQGTICIPKVARNDNYPERIRLASSDQTIMSFNVLMEDSDYRKSKKKNIFGGCLHGATDDDDGPYMPKDEASGSKSGYKQKLALSKTAGNQLAPGDMQRKPKKFFGPCKPGGCLDPPFGEDRYSYLPPDTKKPSTDHEIDTKITDSHHLDNKIVEEIPIPPSSDNEIDTKTPKASTSDNEINERHPKASPSDSSTENKQSRCPKKENTCPAYDYKVDPATTPFSLSGFGSAARSSKESPDALDRNETNISSKQRKRKGSSDSTSTIKISKRISGINSSMLNVSKRRNELPLEDKESNSIITYAGDEDEVNNEKINKNRKSSISTNRTSFDLNAPYYLPPKRDSRDKDTNEKTEKLRRSLEPLGKAQNENYLDERDDIQKRVLRMGSDLQNEDTLSLGEHGQLNRKTDNNITNTKYIKRPSLQRSQDNEVDKPNPSVKFPPNNTGKEFNEGAVVFLDSPDYFDKTKTINYKKDQVNTSESISKKFDETTQKYKTNEIFAVEKENVKDSNANTKEYNGLTQLNSYGFDIKTGKEESLDTHPENDIADISYQDVKSLKDVDIKRAESSNKIDKLEPQSEKHNDYLEFDTTNAIDETKKLQVSSKDHQVSEYFEGTPESKSWPANKEAKRYSLENLDSKDIVTLKSGAFYKEISDAESDYKVTDSRSSFMYKKYEDNYNTAANITTDKDLSSMFRTSITKVDRNSKDKLYEHKVTASNLHCIDNGSSKSSDGDDYKLENIHSINQDTETRKYKEGLLEIGKVLDIDNGSQNYNEISENNDNSLNTNLKYQIYDNMAAKRDSYLNIDNRNKNYDEISSKGGSNSNIDNRTRQHDELLAKRDSSLNTDIRIRKFHEKSSTKTGSRDSIDIRSQKYDELSANRGSSANMNIKPQKYEAMLTKEASDSNMNIMTLKYEEVAAKTEASSNKFARDISLDLAFQNSFDGSVRVLKTIETPLDSKIQVDPNIFLVQKRITHDGEKTQVLIDSDTNMTIQLNRNSVDSGQEKDHNIHKGILISDEHETHSQHQNTHPHVTFSSVNLHENLSYLYENELIPLQNMIKNLKAEIDALAGQHRRRERVRHQRLRPVARCSGIVLKK